MKTPLHAFLVSTACVALLTALTHAGGHDAKPVKKTVRAEDGVNIVCEIRGHGDTALIFLHGLCGERAYWKNQADVFARDYRVITLDQAGHGESGKDRKEWTIRSLADDVEAVVKDLGLKRVILVGHSMSGPVALMAARRMPGKVVAVIGVDTLQNAEFKMPEEAAKKVLDSFSADFKATMRGSMPGLLHEKTDADLRKWLTMRAEMQDEKAALSLMRDLWSLDTKMLFKEAKVPVRCINSAGGFAFYNPTEVGVNKKYADYDAVLINDVGHFPMLEKPTEFNQKLRALLKEFAVKK